MEQYGIYTANAGTETAMFVILGFLLLTCFLQKNHFATTKPLIHLTCVSMLLLTCQISEWMIMCHEALGYSPVNITLKRITYSLDYAMYYSVAFCFFRYVNVYISELRKEQGLPPKDFSKPSQFLVLWGIGIFTVFTTLMFNDRFYYISKSGQELFEIRLYALMFLLGTMCVIFSSVTLIRNRDILRGHGLWLLIGYVTLPNILAIFDIFNGMCISYLLMCFFVFILYVEIDLRRGNVILEQAAKISAQEANLTELRTKIMLSQMQPHFLYNTLTTISGLCYLENAPQAKEVVDKFSDYFRENLDSMGKDSIIPFEKELEHIQTYLWLEQVRFGDALQTDYRIGPKGFSLPSLSLQPLAENAVKHGIRKKKGGGTVTVEPRETSDEYLILIRDDGAGFCPGEKPNDGRSHIGIENISERLRLLQAGYLQIASEKGLGTTATVHIYKGAAK